MGVLSGIDNLTGWALLQKNGTAIEKSYAAGSSSANDIAYFKSVAATLNTPADLLKNYRALTFVCTAYGLASDVDQTAILKQLMTQNPNSSTSLAQQLSDNNYRVFANAMSNWNPPPFSTAAGINKVISGYQQNSFDTSVASDSQSLSNALYFTQNAQGLTSIYQIMSDPTLLTVVTTSLGIPQAFGNLSFDQQVSMLQSRVNMKDFSTASGVAGIVNKYLALDQLNQVTSGAQASSPLLALFGDNSDGSQGITLTASLLAPGNSLNLLA